jgi:uncharacterized protein (DUF305 family)
MLAPFQENPMKYRTLLFATALTAGFASYAFAQQDQNQQMPANQPSGTETQTNPQDMNQTQPMPGTQDQSGQGSSTTQSDPNTTQPVQQGQMPPNNEEQNQAQTGMENNDTQNAFNVPEACRTHGGQNASETSSQQDMSSSMPGMNQQNMGDMSNMTETQRGLHDAMVQSMNAMATGMMAKDADVAFMCSMIPHHQAAIAMARAALKEADNPQARNMARRIIRGQSREIRQMTRWVNRNAERESRNEGEATSSTTPPTNSNSTTAPSSEGMTPPATPQQ